MKKYLNQGSDIMNYLEILVRTEVYLQKISAELVNNGADKEVLKNAMGIIENLILKEE